MYLLLLLGAATVVAARNPDQRIINGTNADPGEYPWQGAWNTAAGSLTCGCMLVHQWWVFTAGHCVGSSGYTAEFGSNTRGQGIRYAYEYLIRHPDYDVGQGFTPNDIAIVRLVGEGVDLTNPAIKPVEGLDIGVDRTRQTCFITGWGRTCGGCPLPTQLQEVQIPVIDEALCGQMWGVSYNADLHICVWDKDNQDVGSCNGDSGGPLVCQNAGKWELCGITSWGYTGCSTNYPSVYARVSAFRAWVCQNTGGEVCW